ncbi:putative GUK1-guanylate kinase [Serendipita vermifera]|nr:putative GUK1-guanylate kinase [Serendipita vermifera]
MPVTNTLRPLVLSGPSGSGKSTLVKRLMKEYPDRFGFSVSHTTRSPRAGEEDGVAYHFTDTNTFQNMVGQGKFIEHAVFSGKMYGTTFKAVEDVAQTGKRCILDIDAQGVRLVKQSHLKPFYLFVAPPRFSDLAERLQGRGSETPETIASRLEAAKNEIRYAQEPGAHDAIVVNDDVERAYQVFKAFALDEEGVEGDQMPEFEMPDTN